LTRITLILTCCIAGSLWLSCAKYPPAVEASLQRAGSNRSELELVLERYSRNSADSLKFRAAEFLIANMPRHWSYDSALLSAYYFAADSLLANDKSGWREKMAGLNTIALRYPNLKNSIYEDIRIITAGYLIQNIEKAFEVWHNEPWAKHANFDEFCEYLLPYKVVDGQPFDAWRDSLKGKFHRRLQSYYGNEYYKNSAFMAASAMRKDMIDAMHPQLTMEHVGVPLLAYSNITKIPAGTCDAYAHAALAAMRSNGIPVAHDFIVQWPYRGKKHSWNVVLDALRKNVIFEELNGVAPGSMIRPQSKLGKVYRHTYAINNELVQLQKEAYVPGVFKSIFFRDVTSEYSPVAATVAVDIHPKQKSKSAYAYLSVFDNKSWIPIAYGKIKRRKAFFRDMCKDIVYLPVSYDAQGNQMALSYPFLLNHFGEVKYLVPDTAVCRTITLHRKFPVFVKPFDMAMRNVGAKLQASNREDFRHAITVHSIDKWEAATTVLLNDSLPAYKYWRFKNNEKQYCSVAELMFFRRNDTVPYKGRIIGTDNFLDNDTAMRKEKAFDNDPLTYYNSAKPDSAWVGMNFGEPVNIKKIICLPRSDDNNIRLGDEYELFYWGEKGWRSLGKQKPTTDIVVRFEHVPSNALLWLRDLTRGSEERIFTYENEEQMWW
jgi:hypothetical protein